MEKLQKMINLYRECLRNINNYKNTKLFFKIEIFKSFHRQVKTH